MGLFSSSKTILWIKPSTTEIYFDRKDNNKFVFNFSIASSLNDQDLFVFSEYFQKNKITSLSVILPPDVAFAKSFLYDTKIDAIERKEVIEIAQNFVNFPINDKNIEYVLINDTNRDKTIIQSRIFDLQKIEIIKSNLNRVGVTSIDTHPIFDLLSTAFSLIGDQDYFAFYPISPTELTVFLAKSKSVYLTNNFRGNTIDFQKTANYSNLYFNNPSVKILTPNNYQIELTGNQQYQKTEYNEASLASSFIKNSTLPLPVTVLLAGNQSPKAVIMNTPTPAPKAELPKNTNSKPLKKMDKKNILPIVAVFVVATAIASVIFWFITNSHKKPEEVKNPVITDTIPTSEPTPTVAEITPTPETTPTEEAGEGTPTKKPTAKPTSTSSSSSSTVNKKVKIQVLNATGVTGQAALLKEKLTALGFETVTTGNSTEKVTSNEIRLKENSTALKTYLKEKLAGDFDATYTSDITDSGSYDVIMTIGEEIEKSTASPTKKPTATPTE